MPSWPTSTEFSARNSSLNHPTAVMFSAITSSDNLRSAIDRALDDYSKATGMDLSNHPSVDKFQNCRSPDDVVQLLLERKTAFENDRDKYCELINRLLPVFQIVCEFSGIVDEVADLVSSEFPLSNYISILPTGTTTTNESDIYCHRCSSLSAYLLTLVSSPHVIPIHIRP